jgi:hypothetical protein
MKENFGYRIWFYFRVGWSTYFALLFAGINTATVTYYLAIEKIPSLESIFPSFLHYVALSLVIILPTLVLVGWFHYRKTAAYGSEAEVQIQNNPYMYKIPPGWHTEALFPTLLKMTEYMIKSNNNEKLDDKTIDDIKAIQKKINLLLEGERIG